MLQEKLRRPSQRPSVSGPSQRTSVPDPRFRTQIRMPLRSQPPAPTYPKTAPGPRPRIGFAIAAIEHIFSVQLQLCRATVELPRQSALPDLWRTTIWHGQRLMTPCSKRVGSTHPKSTTNEQHANAKLAGYCVAGHRCNYKATTATMLQNKKTKQRQHLL